MFSCVCQFISNEWWWQWCYSNVSRYRSWLCACKKKWRKDNKENGTTRILLSRGRTHQVKYKLSENSSLGVDDWSSPLLFAVLKQHDGWQLPRPRWRVHQEPAQHECQPLLIIVPYSDLRPLTSTMHSPFCPCFSVKCLDIDVFPWCGTTSESSRVYTRLQAKLAVCIASAVSHQRVVSVRKRCRF